MDLLSTSPARFRRPDIDALRSLAVLLLIPFHTARLFDAGRWHMKDGGAPYWAADLLVRLLAQWQMPLLFLLAGLAAGWALDRQPPGRFLKDRAARLLLPLAFGILVIVPPQVLVERITPTAPLKESPALLPSAWNFLPQAYACCYPAANLSWHHLWFLPYLFAYAAVLALLPQRPLAPGLAHWLAARPWRLLLPSLALLAVEALLRPAFPSTHNLVADWADHAHYLLLVLAGWWLARQPGVEAAILRGCHGFTLGALGLTAAWLASLPVASGGLGWADPGLMPRLLLRIAGEWLWLLALLGLARRFLARPISALAWFVPLSLPFYILHQTIIVLLGWALLDWTNTPLLTFALVAAASLGLSLAGALLVARSAVLRPLFGLGGAPRLHPVRVT